MRRLRAFLRPVHLWTGLGLCLLLVVLGVTGSALTYKEAYWRLVHPELRAPADGLGPRDHAAALETLVGRYGPELRSVKLPEPGVGGYHLYLTDGEALVAPGTLETVDRWRTGERAMGFLFDLHAHLMAGETGEKVGGVVGLVGVFLVLSGLVLWWPARRRLRWKGMVKPASFTRRALLPSHRDLGAVTAPLLLILLVTAWGIVFYGAAGTLLHAVLPGPPAVSEAAPAVAPGPPPDVADARILERAGRVFPDARLVFYYPPTEAAPFHGFRMKRPCELHPNGRTFTWLDGAGEVLRQVDACAQPAGQKALYAVYPLHSGKAGSHVYKALVFLGGLVLTWVSATGAAAYLAKLRTDRRRARRAGTREDAGVAAGVR